MMLSTSQKVFVARSLSSAVLFFRRFFGRPAELRANRRGVLWSLNLKEGIDFAIYLLGGFEVRTLKRYEKLVKPGNVVLDIGANVGAHTLPLAQLVGPEGKVFSFEPTAYAFAKQKLNISLNPELALRIEAHQMMLMANDAENLPNEVYSSWPLETSGDLHAQHHGRLMSTQGARRGSLDSFLHQAGIQKLDFIKLDVDGNELNVLLGARASIAASKPVIMLELAPYVYEQNPAAFDDLLRLLWDSGYQLTDVATGKRLPQAPSSVRAMIPAGGGMNVLATA